jgi:gas vesicle protein
MNPWISHVKAYHALHPNLSYKKALSQSNSSYKKKQSDGGIGMPSDTVAQSVSETAKVLGDTSNKTIDFVSKNKENNGSYSEKVVSRTANKFRQYKKRMEKGKFQQMSDSALWKYLNDEVNN